MKIANLVLAAMALGAVPAIAAPPLPVPAAAAQAPVANGDMASVAGPATLATIVHPPIAIASANVLDANGATIGTVQRVEVTPAGVPTKVAVTLIGKPDQIAVLDAGAVTYDASKNQIVTRQAHAPG